MSTEDDTFRKLKQTPWKDVDRLAQVDDMTAWFKIHATLESYVSFLASHGWELTEYESHSRDGIFYGK